MERTARDAGVIVAPHRDVIQLLLRRFRAAVIQLCAVCHGVFAGAQQMQGIAFPAAGIQQVCGFSFWKPERAFEIRDVRRIGWIVPEADVVHQPAYCRSSHGFGLCIRQQRFDIIQPVRQRFHKFRIIRCADVEPGHCRTELYRVSRNLV